MLCYAIYVFLYSPFKAVYVCPPIPQRIVLQLVSSKFDFQTKLDLYVLCKLFYVFLFSARRGWVMRVCKHGPASGARIPYVFYHRFVRFRVMLFALLLRAKCLQTLKVQIGIISC